MSNEYVDLQVIESNRLHSEEADISNNENLAMWKNNLQDIIHLEAGDKVSVHSAIISERGVGQLTSIEVKGVSLGYEKEFEHIVKTGYNACSDLPSGYERLEGTFTTTTKTIRDDTGNFLMGYYLNMNAHNYIHLPRRWWINGSTTTNWSAADNIVDAGMSLWDPFKDKYALYEDFYQIVSTATNLSLSKPKNNNDRYTVMMRDDTYYSESAANGNLPLRYKRDPENALYRRYRELKEIVVPKGFNSPDYIATDITRQLQNVKEIKTFQRRDTNDSGVDNQYTPGFPLKMYKTVETETYKPFDVAYNYTGGFGGDFYYDYYINGLTNASGWQYMSNYHVVATKRPELYETGRLVNRLNDNAYSGIMGSHLYENSYGDVIVTNLTYTTTYLDIFRDFILAQEKYPEVFDIFSDSRTPYSSSDTIDNSRWMHINRYNNASMTLDPGDPAGNSAQLGWGGYLNPTWNASNTNQLSSVIYPFEYDASQKDKYYEFPNEALHERTYGCFGRNASGYLTIYGTKTNGSGSTLATMLYNASGYLEGGVASSSGRKFGFDLHFSAPAMCYVLPYAGWLDNNITSYGVSNASDNIADYTIRSGAGLVYDLDSSEFKSKLYLGADSPELTYDGSHFNLTNLHTNMNRGNNNKASNPFQDTPAIVRNDDESDIVYFMNPREQYNDWTPARKPYVNANTSIPSVNTPPTSKTHDTSFMNTNIEAWRIYDSLCGVTIEDFNLTENQWEGTLWEILGFSYKQFNSKTNTRLSRIDYNNVNDLSIITTNAEINEGDTKIYSQNFFGAPLYNNMLPSAGTMLNDAAADPYIGVYYPEIIQKTQSISIIADNLPTRMIRGYYTIRSNIIDAASFVGGKVNNTNMPIVGIVDKMNAAGDMYFSQDSGLEFTITKPMRLASITTSIHDPNGSFANCSEQSSVIFKIQKNKRVTFDVVSEILQNNKK